MSKKKAEAYKAFSITQKDFGQDFKVDKKMLDEMKAYSWRDEPKALKGRKLPIVILDEGLEFEHVGPQLIRVFKRSFLQRFYLRVYNFLVWVDRTQQNPREVMGVIKCNPTPQWLSRSAEYFLRKSK